MRLMLHSRITILIAVERVLKKSRGFRKADRWDVLQNISLTPQERIRIALALRKRAYPGRARDVRAWHHAS